MSGDRSHTILIHFDVAFMENVANFDMGRFVRK